MVMVNDAVLYSIPFGTKHFILCVNTVSEARTHARTHTLSILQMR